MLFCSLKRGIFAENWHVVFCRNSLLFNLSYVWILFWNASSHSSDLNLFKFLSRTTFRFDIFRATCVEDRAVSVRIPPRDFIPAVEQFVKYRNDLNVCAQVDNRPRRFLKAVYKK